MYIYTYNHPDMLLGGPEGARHGTLRLALKPLSLVKRLQVSSKDSSIRLYVSPEDSKSRLPGFRVSAFRVGGANVIKE